MIKFRPWYNSAWSVCVWCFNPESCTNTAFLSVKKKQLNKQKRTRSMPASDLSDLTCRDGEWLNFGPAVIPFLARILLKYTKSIYRQFKIQNLIAFLPHSWRLIRPVLKTSPQKISIRFWDLMVRMRQFLMHLTIKLQGFSETLFLVPGPRLCTNYSISLILVSAPTKLTPFWI